MVIRSVRNWQKDGLTINGIELSQEINPYICGQLISTRGQDHSMEEGKTGYLHAKEVKSDPYLTPYTK